jgi:menaquinone-dependent protoporphyrinogen oxidase
VCEVPIFYATREGQTRRIAEHLARSLRLMGSESAAIEVASPEAKAVHWHRVRAVILGASLHAGRHQREAEAFVRSNLTEFNARPSVFFSVSLSICSPRREEVHAARTLARAFPDWLGWRPRHVMCFGGRLAYTQYGLVTRFIMRRIARKAGGPTDTSRDHELTDWHAVQAAAATVAGMIGCDVASASSPDSVTVFQPASGALQGHTTDELHSYRHGWAHQVDLRPRRCL